MKRKIGFKLLALGIICSICTSVNAQTLVTDSTTFATAYNAMKTSGGGTIVFQNDITLRLSKIGTQTYSLESNASNPIQINTQQYKLISNGDGVSADSCMLKIGNNVDIFGTNVVISNLRRGHIRVVGGSVISNTSTPGAAAIYANDGWVFIWGGTVGVNATGLTAGNYAYGIDVLNYMSLNIAGGTISAAGDYTRAVSVSEYGNGFLKPISGATITASGINAYGIEILGIGASTLMTIGNNLTINTSSSNASDVAIVNGGTTSMLVIPASVTNLNITASTNFKQVNSASVLYDLRGITISASPTSGSTLTYPSNSVTLTASGNSTMTNAGIYWAYNANPTVSSPNITTGGTVAATSATTTIKAAIGKLSFIDSNISTFTFTVNNLPANTPINVSTFADLQAAYTTSQTAVVDTTRIVLLGSITNTSSFTMTPDAAHPVVINANNFQLITGANLTLGGALKAYSTTSTGIIKIAGAYTTTISGGIYTVYGSAPIIYANPGSGVTDAGTKVMLSNSTFTVNGTTSAASIVKFATTNGNLLSATNCTFNVTAKGIAFSNVGPQTISISSSTLNMAGSDAASIVVSQSPTSAVANYLTVDGLTLNMSSGKVFTWGGSKAINTVVRDLTIVGATSPTLLTTGGTGTNKFYDFRAYTPTVNPVAGSYSSTQSVALSLTATAVAPVDAASATIVYTTDGSEPTATSTAYSAPISVPATTTIKAAALKDGFIGKSSIFTYSISTTLNPLLQGEADFQIFPTSVDNLITISKPASEVVIYDIAGKSLLSKSNVSQININTLHSGIYFVKVNMADNLSKTFKIIKK